MPSSNLHLALPPPEPQQVKLQPVPRFPNSQDLEKEEKTKERSRHLNRGAGRRTGGAASSWELAVGSLIFLDISVCGRLCCVLSGVWWLVAGLCRLCDRRTTVDWHRSVTGGTYKVIDRHEMCSKCQGLELIQGAD